MLANPFIAAFVGTFYFPINDVSQRCKAMRYTYIRTLSRELARDERSRSCTVLQVMLGNPDASTISASQLD